MSQVIWNCINKHHLYPKIRISISRSFTNAINEDGKQLISQIEKKLHIKQPSDWYAKSNKVNTIQTFA